MATAIQCLLCQVDASYLALPLPHVIEVCRPLALTRVADAPDWILGVCVLRGSATPVLDARRLLGSPRASGDVCSPRWVALRVEQRCVALAVDAVLYAAALPEAENLAVAPLVAASAMFSALGTLDSQLLLVFQTARIFAHEALAKAEAYAREH